MNKENEQRALALHKKSIIIDALASCPAADKSEGLDAVIKAGITAANVTVTGTTAGPLEAIKGLSVWYDLFEKHGDRVMLVTTGQDVERAKREGKFGVIMGTQNADILAGELGLLSVYKKLGLRIIQLTYYSQNLLGEGGAERTNSGLSNFGIEAVEEMNRLKLLIDIAHSRQQVTLDAIKYSKDPVIASHSNALGLVDHCRNKTDEEIKALAEKGGVMGICAYSPLCTKGVRPTMEDFLNMVDYVVKLVGADYVGVGLDIQYTSWDEAGYEKFARLYPKIAAAGGYFQRAIFTNEEGQDDIGRVVEITKGLVARGYSDGDIEKILGLNFLRVFKQLWG